MMQFNPYQREMPMNSFINCCGNFTSNNFAFPQQSAFMNQQMMVPNSVTKFSGNNQINFMFPQNNLMSHMEQSTVPLSSQIPKKKRNEGALNKTKDHNENQKKTIRKQFSKEEDQLLLELVEKFGDKKWKLISKRMPNRSTRQCHERYKYFLSPKLSNNPWTEEECMILEMKYQEIGPKWAEISTFLNNRSAVSVKNKWGALERKKQLRAMIPLINELYLTNHKILKGINIKRLKTKSKRNSKNNEVPSKTDDSSNDENHQNSDFDDFSDLFNEESEESNEDDFNSMNFDSEAFDDDLLSIWD